MLYNNIVVVGLIKAEGFETYLDEERGDFTFIEAREL
jgi:hypothetical protein